MTVGFVGLGVMGEPMCRNLVRGLSEPVIVFDVQRSAMDRLVADGATAAASLADVVAGAEVVHLSLPGGPELQAVFGELITSMSEDQTIVDHTTAPYQLTRELAAVAEARGVSYCDAPVARTRQAAIDGTLSIMVGGEPADVERIRPSLNHMAAEVSHCGPVGAGQVTKLLNNVLLVQNLNAVAEAHAIIIGLGLDPAVVFETLTKGSADSFALRNHGKRAILPGDYPTAAFPTRYQLKDVSYALDMAAEAGVDARGAELARDRLIAAMEAGFSEAYWPVIRQII